MKALFLIIISFSFAINTKCQNIETFKTIDYIVTKVNGSHHYKKISRPSVITVTTNSLKVVNDTLFLIRLQKKIADDSTTQPYNGRRARMWDGYDKKGRPLMVSIITYSTPSFPSYVPIVLLHYPSGDFIFRLINE